MNMNMNMNTNLNIYMNKIMNYRTKSHNGLILTPLMTRASGASGQGQGDVGRWSRKRNIFGRWGRACPLTAMTSSSVGHTFNFHYTLLRCLAWCWLAVSGCDPGCVAGVMMWSQGPLVGPTMARPAPWTGGSLHTGITPAPRAQDTATSSDPTLTEKTYRAESTVHHTMFWPAVAALSLALSALSGEHLILSSDASPRGLMQYRPDQGPVFSNNQEKILLIRRKTSLSLSVC